MIGEDIDGKSRIGKSIASFNIVIIGMPIFDDV
jgi:hypothetical protein